MFKQILISTLLLFFTLGLFAQKVKVANAITFQEEGDLKSAYEAINMALDVDNEKATKTINWPRAWQVKGNILYDIHKMGIRNIAYEPLFEAYNAYMKALELDIKHRMVNSLKEDLKLLQPDLYNYATKTYKLGRFDVSTESYLKYLNIRNHELLVDDEAPALDTAFYYNAGLSAFRAEEWSYAIDFFTITAQKSKFGEDSFFYLYSIYQAKQDTVNAYEALKSGFSKYPESENINIELVKFCMVNEKSEEAITYIDYAINRAPDNATFYSLKGRALEDIGNDNDAILAYKKAIEIDDTLFTPTYNLAVIYFNRGVRIINSAIKLPQEADDQFENQIALGNVELVMALPLFEKARSINPMDDNVKESLQFINDRLGQDN